jgi:hypothetical protein
MLRPECFRNVKACQVQQYQGVPGNSEQVALDLVAMLLCRLPFDVGLVRVNVLASCFPFPHGPILRGAIRMPERVNRIPLPKSWADEIDDLYHDATERSLAAIVATRERRLVRDAEESHVAEDLQRPVSLHR